MTETTGAKRHPFLEDLADDVVLTSNTIREPVIGKDAVLRIIRAGAGIYEKQTTTYIKRIDDSRTLLEYDADLVGGRTVHAIVVIDWNEDNRAQKLNIGFAPLGGALAFATRLGELLPQDDRKLAI
ncbi:hypothetical protein [Rhizobium sp. BK379]|uniref:hypothetical protein n=1 Tax=Rhizobium sp. BK379 TaxID=2587059 RepID=UPI001609AA2F|nr:hypothetical protein [Rhizobium sp. BK379]MBB3444498.1 hypothetical protein [Rhizobium sp. BK379]